MAIDSAQPEVNASAAMYLELVRRPVFRKSRAVWAALGTDCGGSWWQNAAAHTRQGAARSPSARRTPDGVLPISSCSTRQRWL